MMKSEEVTRILENAIRIGKGVIRYGSVASYIPELARSLAFTDMEHIFV